MHIGARFAVSAWIVCLLTGWAAAEDPVPGVAAEQVAIPPALQALADAQAGNAVLSGTFRWLTGSADGGEVREKRGDFTVARGSAGVPARYNLKVADPDGSDLHRWCFDGQRRVQVERTVPGEDPTISDGRAGAAQLDLDRIVACVLLDLPTLQQDFSFTVEPAGDGATRIVFTPTTLALREELSAIRVTLREGQPQEVQVDEARGTRIRLVILTLDHPATVDPGVFQAPAAH